MENKRPASSILINVLDFSPICDEAFNSLSQSSGCGSLVEVRYDGPWGMLRSNKGWYLIHGSGIIMNEPLSPTFQFGLGLYLVVSNENNSSLFSSVPHQHDLDMNTLRKLPITHKVPLNEFIWRVGNEIESRYIKLHEFFKDKVIDEDRIEVTEENEEEVNTGEFEWDLPREDVKKATVNEVIEEHKKGPAPVKSVNNQTNSQTTKKKENTKPSHPVLDKKEAVKQYSKFLRLLKCNCEKPAESLITVLGDVCTCGISVSHKHCKSCGGSQDIR